MFYLFFYSAQHTSAICEGYVEIYCDFHLSRIRHLSASNTNRKLKRLLALANNAFKKKAFPSGQMYHFTSRGGLPCSHCGVPGEVHGCDSAGLGRWYPGLSRLMRPGIWASHTFHVVTFFSACSTLFPAWPARQWVSGCGVLSSLENVRVFRLGSTTFSVDCNTTDF